jgi:hypothetical protein
MSDIAGIAPTPGLCEHRCGMMCTRVKDQDTYALLRAYFVQQQGP